MDTEFLAKALCYGFSIDERLLLEFSGKYNLRDGFTHGIVFLVNGERPLNTVLNSMDEAPEQAIELKSYDGQLVARYQEKLIVIEPIAEPISIGDQDLAAGKRSDFFSMHSPRTLFSTPLRECVFAVENEICKFCSFDGLSMRPLSPEDFVRTVEEIVEELGFVPSVALGAGTPNKNDHGVKYFAELTKLLRTNFAADVSVEMVPPHDLSDLDLLFEAGVSSMIMSLELWDDNKREHYCPGKSYVPKSHYLAAHDYVQRGIGSGTTSSVLLVGLEDMKSTVQGITGLTSNGVVPTLIPFRPYKNTQLSSYPYTDHIAYMKVSATNRLLLKSAGISPETQKGCAECGGCSIEINVA